MTLTINWICFLSVIFSILYLCVSQEDVYKLIKDDIEQFASMQYPETSEIRSNYDFIIVGAGTAGCVLANRLSEMGRWRILIIEVGGPESRKYNIPTQLESLQHSEIDWGYYSEPSNKFAQGLEDNRIYIPRGKVVGGSSVINGMIYTRGNPEDYNRWENIYKCVGWSFNKVEKYFKKLEDYAVYEAAEDKNYFGHCGPLHVEVAPYRTEFSTSILKAAQQYGLKLLDTNGPDQIGISRLRGNVKHGYRFSDNSAYLIPIRGCRPNLELKYNCLVTKILINNESKPKAIGVEFSCESKNYTVYADKEVIVSAGVINSPQLLILSGIGPRKHLEELDIPLIKDLPVGENLMDHIRINNLLFLTNKTTVPPREQQVEMYGTNRSGPLSIPSSTEAIAFTTPIQGTQTIEQLFPASFPNEFFYKNMGLKKEIYHAAFEPFMNQPGFAIQAHLLQPKSRGYLYLRSKNPYDHPKIFLNYFEHEEDLTTLVKGARESIAISQQEALKEWNATLIPVKIPKCAEYESDEYWACSAITMASSSYHPCGTCKMGSKDDPTAVVDPQLKVIGVDNLRVVDGSIIPEINTGHIHAPIVMIAEKAADMIKLSHGIKWYSMLWNDFTNGCKQN